MDERAAVVPRAARRSAVVGHAGRAGRAAVLRRLAALARRRAAADRRGVRVRAAARWPARSPCSRPSNSSSRRSPSPRSTCRCSPGADDVRSGARGAAAVQPRDRLRRGARVRQRRREPRLVGRPARGAGDRPTGERARRRRGGDPLPSQLAALGWTRTGAIGAVVGHRPGRRAARRARPGALADAPAADWTRWPACTATAGDRVRRRGRPRRGGDHAAAGLRRRAGRGRPVGHERGRGTAGHPGGAVRPARGARPGRRPRARSAPTRCCPSARCRRRRRARAS